MHSRTKQERKFPPPLYAAFFLALLLCAAVYAAAAVHLWQSWTAQTPQVVSDAVDNDASSRPSFSAVHEMVKSFMTAVEEVQPVEVIEVEEPPQPDTEVPITIDFDTLLAVNRDVVGWLYCPGTSINFPILQTREYEKYLNCLFVDGPLMKTPNTVIYGSGTAEGGWSDILLEYTSQKYYEEHPEIWLLTPAETYCIHLLGGREIPSNDLFFTPDSSAAAEKEMLHVMEESTFIAPAQLRGRLVTLSVSAGKSGTSRFVVFGLTK